MFHIPCQSSSHCVIKFSTKNDPKPQKSLDIFTSHFVHTFDVWKFLGFEENISNWMTDELNSIVQSCFGSFVDKYLNLQRAQKPRIPFFMVHLVVNYFTHSLLLTARNSEACFCLPRWPVVKFLWGWGLEKRGSGSSRRLSFHLLRKTCPVKRHFR